MSLAQRLAWLEVLSTLGILSVETLASLPPEGREKSNTSSQC